ncbi:uncharacterized protein LAESUDRAFT_727125 [Laetiporus sulphureus 93-53]|uniref:Uncharacterized protein n=1 Tax=Laetiporus sulphureus 93-53 TaxID=1314785 RepID=A0A165DRK4_9APHY|nr:uncharacterized protein LAESUDRAFT_727125 [Laetiporus sulphureus 93-53]KZT05478.1 hypothetical protein LAESUDRAFT_727125 [Laetiporus sulphureus 93-53]
MQWKSAPPDIQEHAVGPQHACHNDENCPYREELDSVQEIAAAENERANRLSEEVQNEKERSSSLEREVQRLEQIAGEQRSEATRLEELAVEAQKERNIANEKVQRLRCKVEMSKQEVDRACRLLESTRMELDQTRRQFDAAMQERASMKELLETRRMEADAGFAYSNTADACSEQDIVRLVKSLNSEVFQVVKGLVDSFAAGSPESSSQLAEERAVRRVGSSMVEILRGSPRDDTIILEIALQQTIVLILQGIISAWDPLTLDKKPFDEIFNRMIRLENQSVAGRWRALTRKYLQPTSSEENHWAANYIQRLTKYVTSILIVAGGDGHVPGHVEESLGVLVRMAIQLRSMIGERTVGSNYSIILVKSNVTFAPAVMEDGFADKIKPAQAGEPVLCPYELGLKRMEKDADTKGVHEVILVKPKVILASFISELQLNSGEGSQ